MDSKTSLCGRLAVALLVTATPAHAALTVFTSQASFLAALSTSGVDAFTGLSTTVPTASPIARSAGSFAYSASSPNGFFGAGTAANPALSTVTDSDSITFSNLAGASAIGGLFFGSDFGGNFAASSVVLTATDSLGATTTQTLLAAQPIFVGFVSTGTIASLVYGTTTPGNFVFPAVDDLTLGTARVAAIPEPESWALLIAGIAALAVRGRRSRLAQRSGA